MAITTELTRSLEIEVPVILAPMAGVSGGALAAAVSNAGGLGIIGGGYCDPAWIFNELEAAQHAEVGVGFIAWTLTQTPALLERVLDARPKAIFLSFGEFGEFAHRIQSRGIPLFAQVQSVKQAREAIRDGVDFVVAQGTEAGGHGGDRATFSLVPEIVDIAGSTPVLAAGGVADGRGLAASLMLGAAGVVCGSAFYMAEEALSHPIARRRVQAANGDDTVRSSVFDVARRKGWPESWKLRALRNKFYERWIGDIDSLEDAIRTGDDEYSSAVRQNDFDKVAVIVGESAGLLKTQTSAATTIATMVNDAETLLRGSSGFLADTIPPANCLT